MTLPVGVDEPCIRCVDQMSGSHPCDDRKRCLAYCRFWIIHHQNCDKSEFSDYHKTWISVDLENLRRCVAAIRALGGKRP